jgi:hypothetical protein
MTTESSKPRFLGLPVRPAMCWASDDDLKNMKNINTNSYVWGEGFQVDASQDFSNFTPKKIRSF